MTRNFFSLIIVMLLAVGAAYAGGGKKDFAIIYIGNSITYGAMHEQRTETAPPVYTSQILAKKLKANVVWRNCGWSGATTYDFLPSHNRYFPRVEKAIKEIQAETDAPIVFSIMLGTNDSACTGPTGCPVSNDDYKKNLIVIMDALKALAPGAKFVFQRPIWYSPNTYNGAMYLVKGLNRLKGYAPVLEQLADERADAMMGDDDAFEYFEKNAEKYCYPENGYAGIFFLHPTPKGAKKLAKFWAEGIVDALD
ncbi:MAG: lipolytic protein G-D-S-L family [Bacteroidaceae bacterium]|nr:lipolytic protein G-D-S-L family [Bacteroidaceae bacterium]MBQ8735880.1 lipolytic protein G-D-S-L family [Bacteroidaceae bacterium]